MSSNGNYPPLMDFEVKMAPWNEKPEPLISHKITISVTYSKDTTVEAPENCENLESYVRDQIVLPGIALDTCAKIFKNDNLGGWVEDDFTVNK